MAPFQNHAYFQHGVESLYCKCTLVKYIHLIISAQQLQKSYMPISTESKPGFFGRLDFI